MLDVPGMMRCLIAGLLLLLAACASHQVGTPQPDSSALSFDPSPFGERPDIVDATGLFALRENQELAFLAFFHDPVRHNTPPHERVYEYIREVTADFDFHRDTRTAAQALDESSGNCLSLAILTTAFSNLANIETGYQLIDSSPVFELRGDVVSKGLHVRSLLYDPAWQASDAAWTNQVRPGIQFDYFPDDTERARVIGNLSMAEYVAMYYSNIAGEAIVAGDIDSAFWFLLESLEHNSENAIALNTLAVVYRRVGDDAMAERIYKYGIDFLPEEISLLRNYRVLLRQQGRTEEAEVLSDMLSRLDDHNPFDLVNAGRSAYMDGQYDEAIGFYKRAVRFAPYLHEAYAGMALAYLKLGDTSGAEREMKHALENAERETARSMYQAKLTVLSR